MKKASDHINEMSLEYARVTAEKRAIPKVADGMKDAHRKALFVIRNKADKIKTVSLSGEVIAQNLYVHGDGALSDAISNLAAPYKNNIPFLHGIGTFGTKVSPDAFAAPRYTYVKRNRATTDLVLVDTAVMPMQENYDGSAMEPLHFLPIIPLVLLNGISGIASGWSTDILPHNLQDVIDGCLKVLDGKALKDLTPKFDYQDIDVKLLEKGADYTSWEFIGKYKIIDTSTVQILELPPGKSLEQFRDHLTKLEDTNKIISFTDKSTDTIDVVIKFKRVELSGYTDEQLIALLKLKVRATERLVCVDFDNVSIRQFKDTPELITEFVEFRLGYYVKRFRKLLADDTFSLQFWQALKLCFDKKLPDKLRSLKSKQELRDEILKICSGITVSDDQVNRITELSSYRWCQDYYQECLDQIQGHSDRIREYADILADNEKVKSVYRKELKDLRAQKFDVER